MLKISDAERRRRLAIRHGLVRRFASIEDAVRGMTVLHATEAATVHLSLWARVTDVTVAEVERVLYDERSVVKQLAMRRTLFVFPRDLLPAALGSAAQRIAGQQRGRLAKDLRASGISTPEDWIAETTAKVVAVLSDGKARTTSEIRDEVPELGRMRPSGPGELPVGPVVMALLSAEGQVLRGVNAGHWRLNKPAWTSTKHWLGSVPEPLPEPEGYAELVRRWLATFGPGAEADLVWWLGATKSAVRRALKDVEAVEVQLDQGVGWVLPDDTQPPEELEPWAALLPTLDPTVMGWKERDFYLDPADKPFLFDTNGNAGNTAWWDGRIVGCWLQDDQDPAAPVRLVVHEDVGTAGQAALEAEAERLTDWLGGVRITNVYASPQMRGLRLP
ncbi:winged helix DNA-binding domain-containing protein [Kribbella sp. NPDC005582]|uniref:winged helix DNA-binding domain-containing protein n=1 Tax=Kribbella sp. NPDC005582 TaxID=3156893 RepID=UPI0033B6082F